MQGFPAAHQGHILEYILCIRAEQIFDSFCDVVFQYYFTVTFNHDNQKALELRTEDVKDCDEWVAAITQARYLSHMTSHLHKFIQLRMFWGGRLCWEYLCVVLCCDVASIILNIFIFGSGWKKHGLTCITLTYWEALISPKNVATRFKMGNHNTINLIQ